MINCCYHQLTYAPNEMNSALKSFKLQRSSNEVLPSKINHNAAPPKTSVAVRNVMNPSIARKSNWGSWFNTVLLGVQVAALITRRKKPNRTPIFSTLCLVLTTSVAAWFHHQSQPPMCHQLQPGSPKKETSHRGPHLKASKLTGRCILHPHPTQIHNLFSQCRKK